MTKIFNTILFLFTVSGFAQSLYEPIDSMVTEKGTILIYPDRTWEYAGEAGFDGVLNEELHELINSDTNLMYKSYWRNDVTITYNENPVTSMKDTLWMCVLDSLHQNYVIPVNGVVTSHFGIRHGRYHNGTDIDLETGDTVYAAFDGKIRFSQYHHNGFGNLVIVRHYNGLETYYGHLSKLLVAPNQIVKAGDPIGLGGNTGHSHGSHLHFEVRFYDHPIDPELIFDFKNKEINDPNLFVHSGVFSHSKSSSNGISTGGGTSGKKYHRIRSGDTLSHIARRNHTTVSKLCKLNKMKPTDTLRIGRTIRVR